eukprot:357218-Chlamydomonas_euryale.AAC.17
MRGRAEIECARSAARQMCSKATVDLVAGRAASVRRACAASTPHLAVALGAALAEAFAALATS